jgi:hypothetical protein
MLRDLLDDIINLVFNYIHYQRKISCVYREYFNVSRELIVSEEGGFINYISGSTWKNNFLIEVLTNDQISYFYKKIILHKPRYCLIIDDDKMFKLFRSLKISSLKYFEIQNGDFYEKCTKKIKDLNFLLPAQKKLRRIVVHEADLGTIPKEFTNLIHLDLSGCYLNKLPEELINLRYLNCCSAKWYDRQELTKIPNTYVELRTLICNSQEQLKFLPSVCTHLRHLECSYTLIKLIPTTYTELKTLECYGTNITEIPNSFTKLTCLHCNKHIQIPVKFHSIALKRLQDRRFILSDALYLDLEHPND